MAQSRKTQVICMGLSKELRLIARSRSYRVQIKGQINSRLNSFKQCYSVQWHDVQIIPRTQRREDIPFEVVTAEAAFRRREKELSTWFASELHYKIKNIINSVVGSGTYRGSQTWTAICSAIDQEFQPTVNNKNVAFNCRGTVTGRCGGKSNFQEIWKYCHEIMAMKHEQLEKALMNSPYIWGHNGSMGMGNLVTGVYGNELKSGTGKTRNATKHSSWERYASPQSVGLRQKYNADASLRRIALQERQERENDRLRRLVSRYANAQRFNRASMERGKTVHIAFPRSIEWPGRGYHHGNGPVISDVDA